MIALQAGAMILQAPTNIGAASRAEMLEVMYHPGAMLRESAIFTHTREQKKESASVGECVRRPAEEIL